MPYPLLATLRKHLKEVNKASDRSRKSCSKINSILPMQLSVEIASRTTKTVRIVRHSKLSQSVGGVSVSKRLKELGNDHQASPEAKVN